MALTRGLVQRESTMPAPHSLTPPPHNATSARHYFPLRVTVLPLGSSWTPYLHTHQRRQHTRHNGPTELHAPPCLLPLHIVQIASFLLPSVALSLDGPNPLTALSSDGWALPRL
jgi:hypothetical protein